MAYYPVIGLEIHIELKTRTKMFCSCLNNPKETKANTNICPVCLGHPGVLPVINREAVRKVIKTGLALNCQIPAFSKFDRKNYFYPDLPKGYQISQYDKPLCVNGFLEVSESPEKALRRIRIRRVHLEEDTGRLLHPEAADYSLVDFNRAGVPLMELVTEPDIRSAIEARRFAEELQLILRYLGVSDADMEKGQMRVEVNISLAKGDPNEKLEENQLGTKAEIKNLNSFRSVERAINYEIERQEDVLNAGEKVAQETRGWNEGRGITVSQREKEAAHDYRYFPEPDLPLLSFSEKDLAEIRPEIPELSYERRQRLLAEYNLEPKIAEIFVQNKELGEYFEKVVSEFDPRLERAELFELIKLAVNYLTTEILGLLQKQGRAFTKDFVVSSENFAEFITLVHQGKISSPLAKVVLKKMLKTGADPSHIIEEEDLFPISDEAEIKKAVAEAIVANPKAVEDYKKGKENALQFLVGQIMAKTKGKVSPQKTAEILNQLLTK